MTIHDFQNIATVRGASHLHLKVGSYPMMRVHSSLVVASEQARLENADTEAIAAAIMNPEQQARFKERQEVDLAYSVKGLGRFRCSVFQQRDTVGMVIRVIPMVVPPMDKPGSHPCSRTLPARNEGLSS